MLALAGAVLPVTPEALGLVAEYEARKILGAKFRADLQHIALATIAAVDALVSWNFKHIVRRGSAQALGAHTPKKGRYT